jgi:hypothetical protein
VKWGECPLCCGEECVIGMNLPTSIMYGKANRLADFGEGLACGELEGCAKVTELRRVGTFLYK